MTRKVPRKLFFVNIRLFLMEVLIIFVTIVFLMAKQAEFYGADLVKESDHYIGWYLLYWGIAVFAAVSVITFMRYFFIDHPIKQLSMATMQVASGDFSIRLKPYPLSGGADQKGAAHRRDRAEQLDHQGRPGGLCRETPFPRHDDGNGARRRRTDH